MLYILQNNLFYTAASHLNAATFMVFFFNFKFNNFLKRLFLN